MISAFKGYDRPSYPRLAGALLGLILIAGCQSSPSQAPPPTPIPLFVEDYFTGTALSGQVPFSRSDQARNLAVFQLSVDRRSTAVQEKSSADAAFEAFLRKKDSGEVGQTVRQELFADHDILETNERLEEIKTRLNELSDEAATQPAVRSFESQRAVYEKKLMVLTAQKSAAYYLDAEQPVIRAVRTAAIRVQQSENALADEITRLDSRTIHVTFIALENRPTTPFAPAGSRAVFCSSTNGGSAVQPEAQLTRLATIADLNDPADLPAVLRTGGAGRMTRMKIFNGAGLPGVTAEFSAMDPQTVTDPLTGELTHRCVQVLVTQPADKTARPQLALVIKDLMPAAQGRSALITETALFNLPAGDHTNTAMVVPFHVEGAVSRSVAILVQISPGNTDPAHIAATNQCLKRICQIAATSQPSISTGDANANATLTAAMQSLQPARTRRVSLAFLANQTGASLCEDLAMETDDATLAQLARNIQANARSTPPGESSIGWMLERTALQMLAKLATDSSNGIQVPAELLAILTTHTGEVGRHPSSLDEVLKNLDSHQELDNRLLAENMIFSKTPARRRASGRMTGSAPGSWRQQDMIRSDRRKRAGSLWKKQRRNNAIADVQAACIANRLSKSGTEIKNSHASRKDS